MIVLMGQVKTQSSLLSRLVYCRSSTTAASSASTASKEPNNNEETLPPPPPDDATTTVEDHLHHHRVGNTVNSQSSDSDLGSTDEVKVFNDEDEPDAGDLVSESCYQAELQAEKSSLIHESEQVSHPEVPQIVHCTQLLPVEGDTIQPPQNKESDKWRL